MDWGERKLAMMRDMGAVRATEATAQQLIATGSAGGYGIDPVDGDTGYRIAGSSAREMPTWTLEKSRAYSVAAYRTNPMARAIVDTYISFCVGDSGVSMQCGSDIVRPIAERFWKDPRNLMEVRQPDMLRDHMLLGESPYEMMVGGLTGVTRWSPINPTRISDVELDRGNPLWPSALIIKDPGHDDRRLSISQVDDTTHLRTGDAMFFTSWKTLLTDRRGQPFLGPVLDWLDSYDQVMSNLIDRTSLARYMVWDVTVKGGQKEVDKFIEARGGTHVPPSGSVEVHNDAITWKPQSAQSGAFEDTQTTGAVLTSIAGGTGLAKTWLSETENANRATSLSMAEPVRRRVGAVQNLWISYDVEMTRYAVDQAVACGEIPAMVDVAGEGDRIVKVRAADSVNITGPEIAAADAQITANTLFLLGQALEKLVATGSMSVEAAKVAAVKGWEDYCGVPYRADLDSKTDDGQVNNLAEHVEALQDPAKAMAVAPR